jgi:hypothetical protein
MKNIAAGWKLLNSQPWRFQRFWRFAPFSMHKRLSLLAPARYLQKHLRQEVLVSPSRQGVFLWEIPNTPELPEVVEARCRGLLSHMLLAAVSGTTEEENDEREDTADPHRA